MRFNFTNDDDRQIGFASERFDDLRVSFGALSLWNTRLNRCAWFMRASNARVPMAAWNTRTSDRTFVGYLTDHLKWSVSLAGVVLSGQPTTGNQPSLGFEQAGRDNLITS